MPRSSATRSLTVRQSRRRKTPSSNSGSNCASTSTRATADSRLVCWGARPDRAAPPGQFVWGVQALNAEEEPVTMTLTPEEIAGATLPSRGGLDRNIALELCRVTEAAALAAARWMGRGNKNALDQAAVNAMRDRLRAIPMDGVVVIGEGEKDEAPMLYIGERIGNGQPPKVDLAVDPVDGTTLLSKGLPNAVAVGALAEQGSLYNPPGIVYMEKLAGWPAGKGGCCPGMS